MVQNAGEPHPGPAPNGARDITQDLAQVLRAFERLPGLLDAYPNLVHRGRFLSTDCLLGPAPAPFRVEIREGRIARMAPSPHLMSNWRFAYRAEPAAFLAFWKAMPAPGYNDVLALAKRGVATIEGDLHPFLANLQYFKDLLALPREVGLS